MPTDIKLDTTTWDYDLSSNGLQVFVENSKVVAQRLRVALQLRQGELFTDITTGLPLSDFSTIRDGGSFADAFMIDYISEVEGVEEVLTYSSELDPITRVYKPTVEVRTNTGQIITVDGGA